MKNSLANGIPEGPEAMRLKSLQRHFDLDKAFKRGSERYSNSHAAALQLLMTRSAIEPFVNTGHDQQLHGKCCLIITAYNLLGHQLSIPIAAYGPIMETQRTNHTPDVPIQHCNPHGAKEALECIEAESDDVVLLKLKQAKVWCIGTHEMSGKGSAKPYVFIVSFVYQGRTYVYVLVLADPKTTQIVAELFTGDNGLSEASKVSHVDVWSFFKDIVFGKRGLDCCKKLGIFCVDGAMMDMRDMVRKDAPQALLHHDGGHRWALRIGDAYVELMELAVFDPIQHDFHNYFGPGKGLKMLGAVCISLGFSEFQPDNLSPARWTGRGTACRSELRLFQSGCIVLQNQIMHLTDKEKKKKAVDLLHRVAEFEHLTTLNGMTDLLDQENIVCEAMQFKYGRINHLKSVVVGYTDWLHKRFIQPKYVLGGSNMGYLYSVMDDNLASFGTCQFNFKDIKVRGANLEALELATNTLRTTAKFLSHGADKRFPDVAEITALGVFEPVVIRWSHSRA